jgi:hypothetical protein
MLFEPYNILWHFRDDVLNLFSQVFRMILKPEKGDSYEGYK